MRPLRLAPGTLFLLVAVLIVGAIGGIALYTGGPSEEQPVIDQTPAPLDVGHQIEAQFEQGLSSDDLREFANVLSPLIARTVQKSAEASLPGRVDIQPSTFRTRDDLTGTIVATVTDAGAEEPWLLHLVTHSGDWRLYAAERLQS